MLSCRVRGQVTSEASSVVSGHLPRSLVTDSLSLHLHILSWPPPPSRQSPQLSYGLVTRGAAICMSQCKKFSARNLSVSENAGYCHASDDIWMTQDPLLLD